MDPLVARQDIDKDAFVYNRPYRNNLKEERTQNNSSWDNHYKRRGRNLGQFDYVNSSSSTVEEELFSDQQFKLKHRQYSHDDTAFTSASASTPTTTSQHQEQQEQQQNPQRPRRNRSRDSCSEYTSSSNKKYDSSASASLSPSAGPWTSSSNVDPLRELEEGTDTFRYVHHPRNNAVVNDDNLLYYSTDQKNDQQRANVTIEGRRLPQDISRSSQNQEDEFSPVGAPESSLRSSSRLQRQLSSTFSQRTGFVEQQQQQNDDYYNSLHVKEQRYYDYAKDNMITFGQGDAPTVSTGLSQEELLQRKRREDTWRKRKEKRRGHEQKNKTNKHRILNLPSILLHSSNGQHQHNHHQIQQHQNQKLSLNYYQNMAAVVSRESSSENGNIDQNPIKTGSNRPKRMTKERKGENGDEGITNSNNSRGKGVRRSMVRRQRGGNNSSLGRRWKVIPVTYVGTNKTSDEELLSSSSTKRIDKNLDKSYDNMMKPVSIDDINNHDRRRCMGSSRGTKSIINNDRNVIQASTEKASVIQSIKFGDVPLELNPIPNYQREQKKNTCYDGLLTQTSSTKLKDDFERFIKDPNLISVNAKREMCFDSKNDNTAYDYLPAPRLVEYLTGPDILTLSAAKGKLPTYVDFTPKSDYSSRNLSLKHHQQPHSKSSPTSIMDVHESSTIMVGVRWNENLIQQEYIVTPQSTKLRPDRDIVQIETLVSKPKSILRNRFSSSFAIKSQNKPTDLDSSNECPSDESPTKQSKKMMLKDSAVQTSEYTNPIEIMDKGLNTPTVSTFINGIGRSVYPTSGCNKNSNTEKIQETNDLKHMPEQNNRRHKSLGRNFRIDDPEAGKFPESYVHFIKAVASVVIQTKMRQKLAKNKLRKLQNECLQNQNTMSASTRNKMTPMVRRSYALAQRARREKKPKDETKKDVALDFFALAAIQIQAAFRGWWVRDCLGVDNYCATMIQKTYLGYHCRIQFTLDFYHIVVVQSICRRWLAMDDAVTRIYCIVRIQAFARGSLVRKKMKLHTLENNVYDAAAIMIQTQWRSFWCEMNFLRAYEDILVVQSIVRGWITRKFVRSWLKANKIHTLRRLQGLNFSATDPQFSNGPCQSKKEENERQRSINLAKPRNDLSPTYINHIEYMRHTLIPRSEIQVSSSIVPLDEKESNFESRKEEILQLAFAHDAMLLNNECVETFECVNPCLQQSSPIRACVGGLDIDNVSKPEPSRVKNFETEEALASTRAGIERRRKHKELEARAKQEEEQWRQETQAAEIAEIEFRRKRMALKAEARKKEECGTTQIKHSFELKTVLVEESFGHDEEKKLNEGTFMKIVDTDTEHIQTEPNGIAISEKSYTNSGGKFKLEPMNNNNTSQKSGVAETKIHENSIRNHPAFSKRGGVANRTRLISGGSGTVTNDSPSTVNDSEHDEGNCINVQQTSNLNDEIPKRISRTNETYHEYMQSQRSESEQKRLDDLHTIFGQAGLLSRVKSLTRAKVEVEDGTILS